MAFSAAMAGLATLLLLPVASLLGWLLARREFAGKSLVESLILLPLVMPPVSTGLILLSLLGRRGPVGGFLHESLGLDVAFTWRGVVLAMAVMALPLFVMTARAAFAAVDPRLEQVAATLGASRARVFFGVTVPLAWPGLLAAMLLSFMRALGEFGATALVAGAIPGRTLTLSTAIWQRVQSGEDAEALHLMALSLALALVATALAGWLSRRQRA